MVFLSLFIAWFQSCVKSADSLNATGFTRDTTMDGIRLDNAIKYIFCTGLVM